MLIDEAKDGSLRAFNVLAGLYGINNRGIEYLARLINYRELTAVSVAGVVAKYGLALEGCAEKKISLSASQPVRSFAPDASPPSAVRPSVPVSHRLSGFRTVCGGTPSAMCSVPPTFSVGALSVPLPPASRTESRWAAVWAVVSEPELFPVPARTASARPSSYAEEDSLP